MAREFPVETISIRRIRLAKALTQHSLAIRSGVSQKHISQIERGKADPTLRVLSRIAVALGVPTAELISSSLLNGMIHSELPKHRFQLPIFKDVVGGDPAKSKEEKLGDLEVQPEQHGRFHYILKFRGRTMEPTIQPGDLLLVSNSIEANSGDIIVCTLNGVHMLRRYQKKGTVTLLWAENPSYDPIVVTSDDKFTIHGAILEIVRRRIK